MLDGFPQILKDNSHEDLTSVSVTAWKVSKYGVFSRPYLPAFEPEKTPYLETFHAVSTSWTKKKTLGKILNDEKINFT